MSTFIPPGEPSLASSSHQRLADALRDVVDEAVAKHAAPLTECMDLQGKCIVAIAKGLPDTDKTAIRELEDELNGEAGTRPAGPSPEYVTWKGHTYTSVHHVSCHHIGRQQGEMWKADDRYVIHPNLVEAMRYAERDTADQSRYVKRCVCMRGSLEELAEDSRRWHTAPS